MSEKYPWYVSATYLIYVIFWGGGTIGGCAYVVFWMGQSGWWFLAAFLMAGCGFQPQKWSALFDPLMAERYRAEAERRDRS